MLTGPILLLGLLLFAQSGFAQLAGSHHLLLHMVANAGLPAIVLVPSNTALEAMLKAQQLAAAASSSDTTDQAVNSSWQQFVQSEQEAPAESILLLLRHSEFIDGHLCS